MQTVTYQIDDETLTFSGPFHCVGSVRGLRKYCVVRMPVFCSGPNFPMR